MSRFFQELAYSETPMGALSLRRKEILELDGLEVFEVTLGDEYLMSSLFHDAEVALSRLGLAAVDGDDLQVKLIDFGLACQFDPTKLMEQVIGTMLYMAPEVVQKKKYDEKSDIWALGIVLFVMLTGRVPYRQKNVKKQI